ncbi:MAG: PAS domain S-box protein [Methanomicrobiaceae archaeon]|nr:PAS domain S-box protein [Methanomicrobiaceae archaeon]
MTPEKGEYHPTFEKDISALRSRLEKIAGDTHLSDKSRLDILFQELTVSLEELEVAHEELLAASDIMEEARQQVESERQRYLDLFEGAPDGYVVTDTKGVIFEVNTAAASMLNARRDYLAGKPLVLYVADDSKKVFHSRVTGLSSGIGKDVREWELALQPRDRPPLSVLVSVSAVREKGEAAAHLRWLLRDITDRKAAQEALQHQKILLDDRVKKLHCLYDIARVIERRAPLEETLRGIVAQIPPAWKYPHSACARIRAGDIECATPNFIETKWKLSSTISAHGQPIGTVEVCYRSEKPDAEEGPFLAEERDLLDVIAIRIGNVIERLRAEEALRENKERLNLAIEGARLGVWDKNLATGDVITDAHWRLLIGYEPGDPIVPWEEHVHPDDREGTLEIFRDHLRGKTPYAEATYRMKTKEGHYVWILTRGKVVAHDAQKRPCRLTGVDQDVTAIHKYQEAIKEASSKLNLLSSITRHDILNQMTALKGFLYLMEERHCGDPESVEMFSKLNMITDNIYRQIIFTRDYQHMGEKNPVWQQVTYVVKRAAESVILEGVSLTVSTGGLKVFADPMLEKAFYNLLDNAIAHGGHVTEIGVSCHEKGEDCVIVVEDNGTGVPASLKDTIFNRGVGRHTGYGLFLTKEILGITGMSIKETGEEGKGARFEITVPGDRCRMDGP